MIRSKNIIILLIIISLSILNGENNMSEAPDFDKMWNFQDPAGTEQRFLEILPYAQRQGNVSYYAQLLTQIARAQGMQGKFEEAHKNLDKADGIIQPVNVMSRVRILLERGRLYNTSGQPDMVKPLFYRAMETAKANKLDVMTIDAIHMLGLVDEPENQIKWNLKAMKLAEESDDQRVKGWLGPLYNNLGWSYFDLGEYDQSQIMFEKSLDFRESIADQIGIRLAKWTIGHLYRVTNKTDKALEIQLALEKEIRENDIPEDGYVYEELGELYLMKGENQKAKEYFSLAWKILSQDQWLLNNEPEKLERLKELSQ